MHLTLTSRVGYASQTLSPLCKKTHGTSLISNLLRSEKFDIFSIHDLYLLTMNGILKMSYLILRLVQL